MRKLLQGVLKGADFHRLTQKFLGTTCLALPAHHPPPPAPCADSDPPRGRLTPAVTELLEAGELKLVPDIAAVYAQIMKAHRKEVPVVFTFASV